MFMGITASIRNTLQQIDPDLSMEGKPVLRFLPVPVCRLAGEAISEICGTIQLLEEDGKNAVMKKLLGELVGVARKAEYNTDGKALPDWFHEIDWKKIKSQGEGGGSSGGGASSNQKETELELQLRLEEARNRTLELRLAEAQLNNTTGGEGGKGGAGAGARLLRQRMSNGDTGAPQSKFQNTMGGTGARYFNMDDDAQARGSYGGSYGGDLSATSSSYHVQRASAGMEIKLTAVQYIQCEVGKQYNVNKSAAAFALGGSARQAERAVASLLECIGGKGNDGAGQMVAEILVGSKDVEEFFDICVDNLESTWTAYIANGEEAKLFGEVENGGSGDLIDFVRVQLPDLVTTVFRCNPCCPKFWEKFAVKLEVNAIKDIDKDENRVLMVVGFICLALVRLVVDLDGYPVEEEKGNGEGEE